MLPLAKISMFLMKILYIVRRKQASLYWLRYRLKFLLKETHAISRIKKLQEKTFQLTHCFCLILENIDILS